MQHSGTVLKKHHGSGWQMLGELGLTVNSSTDHMIDRWLTKILGPLALHADFLKKVLTSAQDAATHAMQAEAVAQFKHIHLLVFVTQEPQLKGKTWGFFRIEKIERATADKNFPDHTIEFYLYLEG
jgi:hypothetical protein